MSHKQRWELLLLFKTRLLRWNLISYFLAGCYCQIFLFKFVLKFGYFIKTIVLVLFFFSKLSTSLAFNLDSWIWNWFWNWILAFFIVLCLSLNWLCSYWFYWLAGSSSVQTAAWSIKYWTELCNWCRSFWWLGI